MRSRRIGIGREDLNVLPGHVIIESGPNGFYRCFLGGYPAGDNMRLSRAISELFKFVRGKPTQA
jgi:hypothetical protein